MADSRFGPPAATSSREANARSAFWPPPRGGWIALATVALLYAAHWFYGALISDTAMVMGLVAALILAAVLVTPRLRDELLRLKGLTIPAVLFGLVILVALWSLTPWTPGGPNPVWRFIGEGPGVSTIDKSATQIEIIKLLGLAVIFVVGLSCGARDDRARFAIRLTLLLGVAFGIWAFIVSVTGAIYQSQGRRLEAHFLNPNTAGTFFAILCVLGLAELAQTVRRASRDKLTRALPVAAALAVFLVCLLDSASRGAATAMLGACIVFLGVQLITGRLKPTRALLATLLGLALLIAALSFAGERLVDRFFESHEASIVRGRIWAAHWQAFLASPLFGYGLGTAETVNKSLLTLSNFDYLWNIRAILNVYLQWLEEAGIVGAAPMFLCIAWLMAAAFRGTLRRRRSTTMLAGLLAVDALVLIHGATDFGLEVPSLAAFWAWLLGLQFSLAQGSSSR